MGNQRMPGGVPGRVTEGCHTGLRRKVTIALQRDEWEELVMEQIARFTDKVLVTEDLALACRSGTLIC